MASDSVDIHSSRIGQVGVFEGATAVFANNIGRLNIREAPKNDPRLVAIRGAVDRFLQRLPTWSVMLVSGDSQGPLSYGIPVEEIGRWEWGAAAYALRSLSATFYATLTLRVDATSLFEEMAQIEKRFGGTFDASAAHVQLEAFFNRSEITVLRNPQKAGDLEIGTSLLVLGCIFAVVFAIATFGIALIFFSVAGMWWSRSRAKKKEAADAENRRTITGVRDRTIREIQAAAPQVADTIFFVKR